MKLNRFATSPVPRVSHFNEWLRQPFGGFPAVSALLGTFPSARTHHSMSRIPVDVFEDQNNYYAQIELPGFVRADVKVEFADQDLCISAVKKQGAAGGGNSLTFARTVSVPRGVAPESIIAKLENGILTVTLPKSSEQRARSIEIL
jgi:HSP20 family protein